MAQDICGALFGVLCLISVVMGFLILAHSGRSGPPEDPPRLDLRHRRGHALHGRLPHDRHERAELVSRRLTVHARQLAPIGGWFGDRLADPALVLGTFVVTRLIAIDASSFGVLTGVAPQFIGYVVLGLVAMLALLTIRARIAPPDEPEERPKPRLRYRTTGIGLLTRLTWRLPGRETAAKPDGRQWRPYRPHTPAPRALARHDVAGMRRRARWRASTASGRH
jgi:hypothetical protein